MSLSTLNTNSTDNDIDLDDEDVTPTTPPSPPSERPAEALARLMLEAALGPKRLSRLLQARASLVIIKTADSAAARLLDTYLSGRDHGVAVQAYTELHRTGGRFEQQGQDELRKLAYGRSVILISQDPGRLLVPEAVRSADCIIEVPAPTLTVIRKTVRAVTGQRVRGLVQSDIDGLGIDDLTTAIRPGSSARACVLTLRRAAAHCSDSPDGLTGVRGLDSLAMTQTVSTWAFKTAQLMKQVQAGDLGSSALRYACLQGPPGTGKTTVAAALAKTAGWSFVSTSVGTWFAESGGHLGDVIRAARRFFDEVALATGPVLGLLDELDALPDRAALAPKDQQWWTPVITFVLTEIDRMRKANKPILLIGATNHHDRLDAALVRPGRIEVNVPVLLPDLDDRKRLFEGFVGDTISADGIASLARLAVMATPAQIESWCKSALARAEARATKLTLRDLLDLVAPPDGRSPEKDRAIALHEAGHAIVAHELGVPVAEISILSMGAIGGFVNTAGHDRDILTRAGIERLATTMLGGRAADMVFGPGPHAGAASDIEAVNNLLRSAMLDLGLYGSLRTAKNTDMRDFHAGVPLAKAIDAELNRLLENATTIITRREKDLLRLVTILIDERVITAERFAEIVGHKRTVPVIAEGHDTTPPTGRSA